MPTYTENFYGDFNIKTRLAIIAYYNVNRKLANVYISGCHLTFLFTFSAYF